MKGRTVLDSIVDLAAGAPIDYINCILEGVVKRLLNNWISSPQKPYYIKKHNLRSIDLNLVAQCPPPPPTTSQGLPVAAN